MTRILKFAGGDESRKEREPYAKRNKKLQNICNDYESFGDDKIFFLQSIVSNLDLDD